VEFWITLFILFAVALVGSYLKSNARDRCMKLFHHDPVIVLIDSRAVWGSMQLESTGFLVSYAEPYANQGHVETAFFVYKPEFSRVSGIFRLATDLQSTRNRSRQLRKSLSQKRTLVWIKDRVRNFFASVRDAIVQSLTMFTGRIIPQTSLLGKNTSQVNSLGTTLIDFVWNSYDPLLEKNIGKKIVYERKQGDSWEEKTGILVRYSKDFLLIFDTTFSLPVSFQFQHSRNSARILGVEVRVEGEQIRVTNRRSSPIVLQSAQVIAPGAWGSIAQEQAPCTNISFCLEETVDAVFPRTLCVIRHLAE